MADQGDNLTTCGHDKGRVCDRCDEETKAMHLEFWKGYDK